MMVVVIVLGCDESANSLNSTVIVVDNAGGCCRSFVLAFGSSLFGGGKLSSSFIDCQNVMAACASMHAERASCDCPVRLRLGLPDQGNGLPCPHSGTGTHLGA